MTPSVAPRHRWPWLLIMIAVGVAGAYLGAPSSETVHAAIDRVRGAKLAAALAVIGGAIGLVVTEALRIAVIGRLVGARVGARDAWDAAVANHVMTAVTPPQIVELACVVGFWKFYNTVHDSLHIPIEKHLLGDTGYVDLVKA